MQTYIQQMNRLIWAIPSLASLMFLGLFGPSYWVRKHPARQSVDVDDNTLVHQ